jgi:hypothetical protein
VGDLATQCNNFGRKTKKKTLNFECVWMNNSNNQQKEEAEQSEQQSQQQQQQSQSQQPAKRKTDHETMSEPEKRNKSASSVDGSEVKADAQMQHAARIKRCVLSYFWKLFAQKKKKKKKKNPHLRSRPFEIFTVCLNN